MGRYTLTGCHDRTFPLGGLLLFWRCAGAWCGAGLASEGRVGWPGTLTPNSTPRGIRAFRVTGWRLRATRPQSCGARFAIAPRSGDDLLARPAPGATGTCAGYTVCPPARTAETAEQNSRLGLTRMTEGVPGWALAKLENRRGSPRLVGCRLAYGSQPAGKAAARASRLRRVAAAIGVAVMGVGK